ncbi:cGMP-dependent protein kinase [Daktulosphaira vitifoliae]|uniref:cGMP-dependent protein kinase n=1 Tax=Daktulosphaira vitifoliae TaxID=58002 RepID=UPI0021A9CC19|nr:cGMP-dependent protein kinase [Daktulosphaira vitifoliae]XP_050520488.1 cGMP-dependent protein kinase [Daktulosphaira vitifoliae]
MVMISNIEWLKDEQLNHTPIHLMEVTTDKTLDTALELTIFHKLTLVRPRELRTSYEIESIVRVLGTGFKFFELLSQEKIIGLMMKATYKCFGPNRFILKQDHKPQNMYYIVKGQLILLKNIYNEVLNKIESIEVCKLNEGDTFGENAVMFDTPRKTSVKSLTTVELICISQDDYIETLKYDVLLEWEANANIIKSSEFFRYLNSEQVNRASALSFIKTYQPGDHVVGDKLGNIDYGHFMIEGKVNMIERLILLRSPNRYGQNFTYKLYDGKSTLKKNQSLVDKFMKVCDFLGNSCFNIGECITNKDFIADKQTLVKCLCVPKWYMYETEILKWWERTRIDIEHVVPNTNVVFQYFIAGRLHTSQLNDLITKKRKKSENHLKAKNSMLPTSCLLLPSNANWLDKHMNL